MFVASILLVAIFAQFLSVGTNKVEIDDSVPVKLYRDNEKVYHFANRGDINEMKNKIGVRDPEVDYNVIVNGFGTGLAPPTEESWQLYEDNLVIVDKIKASRDPGLNAVDLSTDPHFPAIGNQLSQGSCGAWAMTYYTYGYLEAKDQGWNDAYLPNTQHVMSPGWTYNKVNGGTDTGSWMWDNGYVIEDWGAATWSTMPYDQYDHLDWGDANAFRDAPLHRANQVNYIATPTVNDIKFLIDSGTPSTFVIDANEYSNAFADGNYIISAFEYGSSSYNHAQTIVGYDDSITDDGETGAFRVANSWGTGWADSGFYWITYDAFEKMRDDAGLYLTYIDDIPDYNPSLLATWHFNAAPTRDINMTLGIGMQSSPLQTKYPFYYWDSGNSLPTYISLDVTEFQGHFDSGETRFFLDIGLSQMQGIISSFKLEHYETIYERGRPTQVSLQSPDVPNTTPGYVTNDLFDYTYINANEALDNQDLTFTTGGVAGWTGVDHDSYDFVDSMQSGDVGDGEISYIETTVTAPISVSWYWKTDAEDGDGLLLYIDGSVVGSMFGFHDWNEHSINFTDSNPHTIRWEFVKNNNLSANQDAAWLDNIQAYQTLDIPMMNDAQADGWNFISFNLEPLDTSLTAILDDMDYGIPGNYEKVMYYDASIDIWQSFTHLRESHFNNLLTWDHTMGLWIRMYVDDTLTIRGKAPVSTNITLHPGWNMVGYPSSQISNMGLPAEITIVGFFDSTMPYNVAYHHDTMNFMFSPDEGYWLYNDVNYNVTWHIVY